MKTRVKRTPAPPEASVLAGVLAAIGTHPSLRAWRQNSGIGLTPDAKRIIKYGIAGSGDISGILGHTAACSERNNSEPLCLCRRGTRLEIEVKTATGRQTKQQVRFQDMIRSMGGVYLLVRSAEDALAQLRELGYCHVKENP